MRRPANPQAAFTLTEVLISLFVLSVGILGVMALFPVGLDATTRTLDSTTGSVLTQSALAELQYRQDVMEDFETNHNADGVWFDPGLNKTFRFTGKPSHSWNAVFAVPDASIDPQISGSPSYDVALVQVAVYRDHNPNPPIASFITGATTTPASTATFADASTQVTFSQDLSTQVRPGYYIREDATGFWYRIAGMSTDGQTATLDREFSDPRGRAGTSFTCTSQVVALAATYLAKH